MLTGNHRALGRMAVSGAIVTIDVGSTLAANEGVFVSAIHSLISRGTLQSGQAIELVSNGTLLASGTLAAVDKVILQAKTIQTDGLSVSGSDVRVLATEAAAIDYTGIGATGDAILTAPDLELGAGSGFDVHGTIMLDAKDRFTNGAVLDYPNLWLSVRNTYVGRVGSAYRADALALTVTDTIDNAGALIGGTSASLSASRLVNETTGTIYGPDLKITLSNGLTNQGSVLSGQSTTLTAVDIANTGTISTNGTLTLTSATYTAGSAAAVLAADTAHLIVAGTFDNSGLVFGRTLVDLQAAAIANRGLASELSSGNLTLAALSGSIANEGRIVADGPLVLRAATDLGNTGAIGTIAGDLTITIGGAVTSSGDIISARKLDLQAASYAATSTSARLGGDTVGIAVSGDFINRGLVAGTTSLDIAAATLANGPSASTTTAGRVSGGRMLITVSGAASNTGHIEAADGIDLSAGRLANAGAIWSDRYIILDIGDAVDNTGSIASTRGLALAAGSLVQGANSVLQAETLAMDLRDGLDNAGRILGKTTLALKTSGFTNRETGEVSGSDVTLDLSSLDNFGSLSASNSLSVAAGGAVSNSGLLYGAGQLALNAAALTNDGSIKSSGVSTLVVGSVTNRSRGIIDGATTSIISNGVIDNAGSINSEGRLVVSAHELTNHGSPSSIASITGDSTYFDISGNISNQANSLIQSISDSYIRSGTISGDIFSGKTVESGLFNYGKTINIEISKGGYSFYGDVMVEGSFDFKAAGDVSIYSTLSAGSTMAISSMEGGLTIGRADPANPGGGTLYAKGNITLRALGSIANWGSTIETNGDLLVQTDGNVTNSRTAPLTRVTRVYPDDRNYTEVWETYETSPAAVFQADGRLLIQSQGDVANVGSVMASGGDLTIVANNISNSSRTLSSTTSYYNYNWHGWGCWCHRWDYGGGFSSSTTTDALLYAGGALTASATANFTNSGTIDAGTAQLRAPSIVLGIVDPNQIASPKRVPDQVIDLSGFFSGTTAVSPLEASRPSSPSAVHSPSVTAPGAPGITYLHSSAVAGASVSRDPSWILSQTGDARTDLTFFTDPLNEQRQIQQALISQTGRSKVDPSYTDASAQQAALYQGTVDFLAAHPTVRLGDTLTSEAKATISKPMLWYESKKIDGRDVLVPELVLPDSIRDRYATTFGGTIRAGDISVDAGRLVVSGQSIAASGDLSLTASDVSVLAYQSRASHTVVDRGARTDVEQSISVASQLSAREKLSIAALDGSLVIEASDLSADTMSLSAHDVVRLVAAKDVTTSHTTGSSSNFFTTTVYDHGSVDEILRFVSLEVGAGGLAISAGGGVTQDVRDNAAAASMAERTTRALVEAATGLQQRLTTNTVSETHTTWNNDKTTLSPVVTAAIGLLVSVMLPGIGQALLPALTALMPGVMAAASSLSTALMNALPTFLQTVAQNAFIAAAKSFVTNSITSAIGGGFDMGRILRSTLTAALTAGVVSGINAELPKGLDSLASKAQAGLPDGGSLLDPKLIGGSLLKVAVDAPIKAAIASAIEGRDFGKTLEADLRSGLASEVVEPALYVGIGDLGVSQRIADGSLSKIVMHAGAGAVGGFIACGGTCAAGGALGAALNEAAIPYQDGFTAAQRQVTSQLLGGLGSLVVGDASMSGATAALNGTTYNRLLHPEQAQLISRKSKELDGKDGLSAAEWEKALTTQLLKQSGSDYSGFTENPQARAILEDMQATTGVSMSAEGTAEFDNYAINAQYVRALGKYYYLAGLPQNMAPVDPVAKALWDAAMPQSYRTQSPEVQRKIYEGLIGQFKLLPTTESAIKLLGSRQITFDQYTYIENTRTSISNIIYRSGPMFLDSDILTASEASQLKNHNFSSATIAFYGGSLWASATKGAATEAGVLGEIEGSAGSNSSRGTLDANKASGAAAEKEVVDNLTGQGLQAPTQVTMTDGVTRCRADCVVLGQPGEVVRIPPGYVAENLTGAVMKDANGNPISSFTLNSEGRAVIEVKAGNGELTSNQATAYPSVENGTTSAVGGNAAKANIEGSLSPTPVLILRKQ